MKTLLATLLVGAAVALPLGAAQARDNVTVRIDTPEFGFRIGSPGYRHGPVYGPPVIIAPAPVYIPPRVGYRPYPNFYGGVRYLPPGHYKRWHRHHHDRHWNRHERRWDHGRWGRDDHDDWHHDRRGRH